jgi:hypothetical protein
MMTPEERAEVNKLHERNRALLDVLIEITEQGGGDTMAWTAAKAELDANVDRIAQIALNLPG